MRGYQKRVIYLKNPGSAIFEEAYFVIREDAEEKECCADVIGEANRIIEENAGCGAYEKKERRIFSRILPFFIGASIGFLIFCLIFLIK